MATLIKPKNFAVSTHSEESDSAITKFLNWCEKQELYRYPILAAIVIFQGSILIPATLILSFYFLPALADFAFLSITISTVTVMVTNMSISPMKVVIPVFALNVLINGFLIALYLTELFQSFF